MTRIAVAGATGRVGRHVVDVLHEGGHDVVAISRANGVDVITGEGLAAALEGVEVVIDTSTGPSAEQGPAMTITSSPPIRTSPTMITVLSGLNVRLASLYGSEMRTTS